MKMYRPFAAAAAALAMLTFAPVTLFRRDHADCNQGRPEDPGNSNKPDKPEKPDKADREKRQTQPSSTGARLGSPRMTLRQARPKATLRLWPLRSPQSEPIMTSATGSAARCAVTSPPCLCGEDGAELEIPEEGITEGRSLLRVEHPLPEEAGKTLGGTFQVIANGKRTAKPLAFSLKRASEEEDPL